MKIAHISDVHWRGIARHKEYNRAFEKLFEQLAAHKPDLIINTGDTFHTKTQGITPEIIERLAWMFRTLAGIAPSYTILGNHDGNLTNLNRKDIISPIHESIAHPRAHLLRKSGVYRVADLGGKDVNLCVYSPFDQKSWSIIKPIDGAINIALYHGSIAGSLMDNNWRMPGDIAETSTTDFTQFHFALMGDIHKHQFLAQRKDHTGKLKPWMAYPGSLIQQNFGEAERKGYLVWDIRSENDWDVEFHQLENNQPFVTIPWKGTVAATIDDVKDRRGERAFLEGTRFRVSASATIPSVEARKLIHSLRETHDASEVVFKYDVTSRLDHISANDLKISKKSLRQDPDAIVRLYLEYITTNIANYYFDRESLDNADQLIRNYVAKLMVHESDNIAKSPNWSIKTLEFDNLFRYGEGNRIDFTGLDGIVGIFGPNKIGKALALDTSIITTRGWKTMGALEIGDKVFDEKGKPCNVVAKSPIQGKRPCYRVVFSDGSNIVADAQHQWVVSDHLGRAAYSKAKNKNVVSSRLKQIKTTEELAQKVIWRQPTKNTGIGFEWAVDVAKPLQHQQKKFDIPPYVLGCWLGDETSSSSGFTCADQSLIENLEYFGECITKYNTKHTDTAYGIRLLAPRLRKIGVLNNKHIPLDYHLSTVEDRKLLLAGLLDTDGYCSPRGIVEFSNTNKVLAEDVHSLICSLGYKPTITSGDAKLNGRVVGTKYRVVFSPTENVFKLDRKNKRITNTNRTTRAKRRFIVKVEEISSVPVQCIVVDSPSHVFLASKNMIPTHNSSIVGAIMYVLYNTTDRGPMKNAHIINSRKNYCKGKIRLNVGGVDYVIERQSVRVIPKRKSSKRNLHKTTTMLNFYRIEWDEVLGAEKRVVLNSVTRDDTDKEIRKLIGTANDFLLTALSSQGSVDRFIKEGPTERKKILARFLELDIFEKLYTLCKEDHNDLTSRGASLSPELIINQIRKVRRKIYQGEGEVGVFDERLRKAREHKDNIQLWLMHHEKSAADVDLAKLDVLKTRIEAAEADVAEKQESLSAVRVKVVDAEKKLKGGRSAMAKIDVDDLKNQLDEFESLKATLHEIKHEHASQETVLNNQKKNVKKLEAVPCGDQFPKCHYIRDGHRDKKKISAQEKLTTKLSEQFAANEKTLEEYVVRRIHEKIDRHQALDRQVFDSTRTVEMGKKHREFLKTEIRNLKASIQKLRSELSQKKRRVNVLEGKEYENKREQLHRAKVSIISIEEKRHAALVTLGGKKESLKNWLQEEEETKSLVAKLKIYDSILAAFSKTGIPAMVLKSQLPTINEELSKILEGIVDFKIGLETDIQSNTMDVYIQDEHSQRIIELASGMEKTIASMALRAAMINLSSLPKPDIFIIDEGFGALDETNIQSCMEMLTLLRSSFKTILVISHVTPVKEIADRIIEVKSDGIESKVFV